jgi:SAM-dependent methyltransferase
MEDGSMELAEEFYRLDEQSQTLKKNAEKILVQKVQKLQFQKVLDVGCGNGNLLHKFPGKQVFGIDKNQNMIDHSVGLEGKLARIDIVNDLDFVTNNTKAYDLIISNYVFSELRSSELSKAFRNINSILTKTGTFCFTMTDPRTRYLLEFPGYKLVFSEPYDYNKNDLAFTVLLETIVKKYVDVGIRDYHNPLEVYINSLQDSGFNQVCIEPINKGFNVSYAVLFTVNK